MQNNIEKHQENQLPTQVVADQSQCELAIAKFFNCYNVEDTENRIFRMLEEWIFDDGTKQKVSTADDARAFITSLKKVLNLIVANSFRPSKVLASEIGGLRESFGITGTHELLDSLLQSWFFIKNDEPGLLDVCNKVAHCHQLVKLMRVMAKEGGCVN